MASDEILPNLGSTKVELTGTLNGSTMKIVAQVAEVAKPLASVDEMVTSGMMGIMYRDGIIAKRLGLDTERQICDPAKSGGGLEGIPERAGGPFTFDMDVKSQSEGGYGNPTRTVKPSCAGRMKD